MSKPHRKSIVREVIERLDSKMAIGESRYQAKVERRSAGQREWTQSTGKIHSFKTRSVYQEHAIRFAKWAREEHHITNLEQLDPRANELASSYLQKHIAEGKSAYTLQAERAALRMFFGDRSLAGDVSLPRRSMANITRSRGAAKHDREFNAANWQPLVKFEQATGLRRQELRDLKVRDVFVDHSGQAWVHVESGKGGRLREVPVLPGRDADVLSVVRDRQPDEHVFERIPKHMDVHSYRREYAQALYLHYAPGRELPPPGVRLRPQDYDKVAAERVTWALGHSRIDVVLRHYIR